MCDFVRYHCNRIGIWLCLFLLVWTQGKAQNDTSRSAFAATQDVVPLASLYEEAYNNLNTSREIAIRSTIANMLENEGRQDKALIQYANICRNYYENNSFDSLTVWHKRLSAQRKKNPDAYFTSFYYMVLKDMKLQKYRMALDSTAVYLNEAVKTDNKLGQVLYYGLTGVIYSNMNQSSKAVNNFVTGVKKAISENLDSRVLADFYGFLAAENLKNKRYAETLDNLKLMTAEVTKLARQKTGFIGSKIYLLTIYEKSLECHMMLNHPAEAERFYGLVLSFDDAEDGDDADRFELMAKYNRYAHNPSLALNQIDYAIRVAPDVNRYYFLKATILDEMGRYADSYNAYSQACSMLKQNISDNYAREFKQFEEADESYKLERQEQAKILDQAQTINKILIFILAGGVTCVILCFVSYQRNVRLKNDFLHSNEQLIEAQNKMKRVNSDLEKALLKVEKSNEKKNEFMANVSHEVRTPLNSIVGFSELITDEMGDEDEIAKEYSSIITSNSDLMLKLVNDILDIGELDSSVIDVEIRNVDVIECAKNTVRSVETLAKQGVQVTFTPFTNEKFVIETDRYRLQQMLTNLLGNACKFTDEGSINLDIKNVNNEFLRFSVSDTGKGIAPELRDKIFERYEKVDEAALGSGLGLYICTLIAKKLKGRIYLDAKYEGGSRFVFEHPIVKSKAEANS